jgi:dTDP-glucose pyrophosphorylase
MKDITIHSDVSIREAMRILDKTAEKCLLVVDKNRKLLGTLTDGDLRRSILSGLQVSENISMSFCTKPITLNKNNFSLEQAKLLIDQNMLDLLPLVDQDGIVQDYITRAGFGDEIPPKKLLTNVPVVIMAGGKGTRMDPFTKILPKPLIPVHDKPIIEHIIDRFREFGCDEFYITVNYKSRILKAYFEELQPDYKVHFVYEEKPLGTAGSLRLLNDKFKKPFFVTNCDIIIEGDYTSLYSFHLKDNYDLTLVASTKDYVIPYGTCELNSEGYLSHINEKPKYDFLINTGLYVLDPNILKLIPRDKFYNITDLIEDLININKRVGVFPVNDDAWIDVGQWAEYQKATEKMLKT